MDESVYSSKTVLRTAEYEGEDMGKLFVKSLIEDMKPVYEILSYNKPMVMSKADEKHHDKSDNCYACGSCFESIRINERTGEMEEVIKCRETGKYRGAACDKCNLRMRVLMFVPILFHNLEGYDSHLFAKSLGLTEGDINCIPKTDEKYISFSKKVIMETITNDDGKDKEICLDLRFLDSVKFTLKSLDSLVSTLGNDQFGTLCDQMFGCSEAQLKLLKQKGVFPYEYMTNLFKLNVMSLPSEKEFHSQLTGSDISEKDYAHAKKVWNAFNCKTMRDYQCLS